MPAVVPVFPVSAQNDPASELLATCHVARPAASEVRILPAHCVPSVILTCPATSSLAPGDAVPIPTFPALRIRIFSVLFVLTTRSIASVVPMKLVPATVPALPRRVQYAPAPLAGVCHVARPAASEVRTLLRPGVPPVILTCQATSSAVDGVLVPIPIFPLVP